MRHILNDKILSLYIDGRLDAKSAGEARSHVSGCPLCRKKAAAFLLAKRMLGRLDALELPEGFDFEFTRRLNEALARRQELSALERLAQGALENIKTALTPAAPALVKTAVSVLIFITIVAGSLYYFAKSPSEIASISGRVTVYSHRTHQWTEASKGAVLNSSDIVRTAAGSEADILTAGKFIVRIKGDTELKVLSVLPRFRHGNTSCEVARGEVLVDITEKFKGSHFEVYTPQAIVTALGTSFAVEVSGREKQDKTWLAVASGAVEVKGRYPLYAAKGHEVIVKAGQKTEVLTDQAPLPPSLLIENEWKKIEELYQIGRKAQVILLISETETRVRELLTPCAIYIYDIEPRSISDRLEEAASAISEAIEERSIEKHMSAIHQLEMLVDENPEAKYDPQLLLFIGAYYKYAARHELAIAAFERVIARYPDSQFASLAQCAIGIIYDEELGKKSDARKAFEKVISNYPNSLEELEARKALKGLNG